MNAYAMCAALSIAVPRGALLTHPHGICRPRATKPDVHREASIIAMPWVACSSDHTTLINVHADCG